MMSLIQVQHLTFGYEGSYELIFDDVSLTLDTSFKTALIGRNARGKTTFLKLMMKEYEYQGQIIMSEDCCYFPYEVSDETMLTIDICYEIYPLLQQWELEKELHLLDLEGLDIFYRPFMTLSYGERTKVLLALLFLKKHSFLLIDEPTNHLDQKSRQIVAQYLKKQNGFLLVSHDRYFIDQCCDHIMAINPTTIEVVQGNFSSWYEDKMKKDEREMMQNKKLEKDIDKMEKSKRQKENWGHQIEKSKIGAADKGYVGHMAAKMMKRSKAIENRQMKAIEEKKKLFKDIEEYDDLKIHCLKYFQKQLISFDHFSLAYHQKVLFKDLTFTILQGERVLLKGPNGCGKSSLIRFVAGEKWEYQGQYTQGSQLKISYVPQDCSFVQGKLNNWIEKYGTDQTLVKTLLRKLGFSRSHFDINLENLSQGQKKKIMLAISLATPAHLYVWDEPLNYIDIFSRMQIEKAILQFQPTLLFVEHDQFFQKNIATQIVDFEQLI